jgi:two-component system CheB/CheR fusion protein
VTDTPTTRATAVCGIGASAGGIEALQQFFGALPSDLGLAYVVVLHLAPYRKSELPAIIRRATAMPVVQVGDHDRIELVADTVYVIAPNHKLEITDTSVGASPFEQPRGQRSAIDLFFRSLAAAHSDGFAIVLSGSGSDGALGARAVKESGGLVLVQDPNDAAYGDMPRAVIATGVADVVLPVENLAGRLVVLARGRQRIGPVLRAADGAAPISDEEEWALASVLELLRRQTGQDFSKYKRSTVLRRLSRRMQLGRNLSIADYLRYLEEQPDEVYALRDDLLITVTTFFRDPDAWAALQARVIGPLVERTDEQLRVWVAGCATGEEAYSMAILFHEEFERRRVRRNLVIFATDVDEGALSAARDGAYARAISTDVSDERLGRYFRAQEDHYRLVSQIRDDVVFAVHNLLRDPPFSRIHLLSCRNLLIYLDRDLQDQVVALFRYACRRDQAYLFLGESETASAELFRPLDSKHRIFATVALAEGTRPALPEILTVATPGRTRDRAVRLPPRAVPAEIHIAALEQAAPPSVLIDSQWSVVHLSASASRYLQQSGGPLARRLTDLIRPELRDDLHALLYRALENPRSLLSRFVLLGFNGAPHRVALLVQRHAYSGDEQLYLLVTFLDAGEANGDQAMLDQQPSSELVQGLREQLHQAEQRISSIRDEHHLTNEELRAANEELQSLNEEYRSTTEELETSKEELQSINEELQTVNNELKLKLDDLSRTNADLENLMVATNLATLFLTADLRIRRHTPALEAIFNIRVRDYDRPIGDQTHTLNYEALEADVRQVLATALPVEREVTSQTGQVYVVRINPYRPQTGDKVEGAVLTFIDVTELRAAQRQIAGDLRRMTRLHELGTHLAGPGDPHAMLAEVLGVAVEITGADMGNIQRCEDGDVLSIAVQHAFEQPFLTFFERVDTHTDSACASALTTRQRVLVEDVANCSPFAGSPSLVTMLAAGVAACQSTPLFDLSGSLLGMLSTHYRSPHRFEAAELQWLDLLAPHVASVFERERAEQQIARAREELEERVAERTRWLSLMHEVSRAINEASTWEDALHQVLRTLCWGEHWQIGYVYLPDPGDREVIAPAVSCFDDERFQAFNAVSRQQRYRRGQSLPGRVYAEDAPLWIDDPTELAAALPRRGAAASEAGLRAAVALPVTLGGEPIAVMELFSDRPHPPDEQLSGLIRDVGSQIARVLEREQTTARIADLLWREQQSLLHTLHDSIGQTLTGLGMLSSSLRQRLADAQPADAEAAAQIASQAQAALEQVRQLAKSLFPVEVDAESLISALRDLASTTESLHKINVRVEGRPARELRNGKIATELYRIAQEAVTNAVKHAQADTIVISLTTARGILELRVVDDGVGLAATGATDGMGLRIMRYRAASIGASLTIESAASGGTMVRCRLRNRLGLETPDR